MNIIKADKKTTVACLGVNPGKSSEAALEASVVALSAQLSLQWKKRQVQLLSS